MAGMYMEYTMGYVVSKLHVAATVHFMYILHQRYAKIFRRQCFTFKTHAEDLQRINPHKIYPGLAVNKQNDLTRC